MSDLTNRFYRRHQLIKNLSKSDRALTTCSDHKTIPTAIKAKKLLVKKKTDKR